MRIHHESLDFVAVVWCVGFPLTRHGIHQDRITVNRVFVSRISFMNIFHVAPGRPWFERPLSVGFKDWSTSIGVSNEETNLSSVTWRCWQAHAPNGVHVSTPRITYRIVYLVPGIPNVDD